ncbi:MAG: hypothetical protein WBD09_07450 [Halobacteriota archaeon]
MNTKAILMSILMIGVVATAAGVTFADFSDIETSMDNTMRIGSLDLVVSHMGYEYEDPEVPVLMDLTDIMPECTDKSMDFDLHNIGESSQGGGHAYLHFKNIDCFGIEKTEPECVAETGMNCKGDVVPVGELEDGTYVYVDGIGADYGENCEVSKHIEVQNIFTGDYPPNEHVDLTGYDKNGDGYVTLDEIVCEQIYLGPLPGGATMYVSVHLRLMDIPEEYFGLDLFDEDNLAEAKWNDWPTNALQKDGIEFDVSFELLQINPPT